MVAIPVLLLEVVSYRFIHTHQIVTVKVSATHQMYTCTVQSKTSILIICCTMDIVFHSICACPLQSVPYKVDCRECNFVFHSFALQNGRSTYMQ